MYSSEGILSRDPLLGPHKGNGGAKRSTLASSTASGTRRGLKLIETFSPVDGIRAIYVGHAWVANERSPISYWPVDIALLSRAPLPG